MNYFCSTSVYQTLDIFVQAVNWSVIYVVLVAAAIFFQTAFVEAAQCSPVNSNLFCYLNGSSVGCSEFDYSLETANCYGITVNFGDAAANAAGVFSFYITAFGSATYILLKASGGKTGIAILFNIFFVLCLFNCTECSLCLTYYRSSHFQLLVLFKAYVILTI